MRDDITRRGNKAPHTLYVLDETTVGPHMADVEKLIRVLHRLVDDWIVDLGSEGCRVVVAGTSAAVVASGSRTGLSLALVLSRRLGRT